MRINFTHRVPVELSVEEVSLILQCLAQTDSVKGDVNVAIAKHLISKLSSVRGDLVKKAVGLKY